MLCIGLLFFQGACTKPKRSQADFEALRSRTSLIQPSATEADVIRVLGQPDSIRDVPKRPDDPAGLLPNRGYMYYGHDEKHMIVLSFKDGILVGGTVVQPGPSLKFPASASP